MVTKQIVKGYLTEDGELKVELPANWQPGEVEIAVSVEEEITQTDWDQQPWTPEELDEMLTPHPSTLGEILKDGLIGGWEDRGITDSVAFIEEQRRK